MARFIKLTGLDFLNGKMSKYDAYVNLDSIIEVRPSIRHLTDKVIDVTLLMSNPHYIVVEEDIREVMGMIYSRTR